MRLMALPSSRVIGHKEYAAGRKSDPTYSMDWRRARVAAFKPRNTPAPAPEEDMTGDQAEQLQYVYDRLTKKEINGKTLPDAVRDLHKVWCVTDHNRAGTSQAVSDDGEYPTGRAIELLRWIDGGVEELKERLPQPPTAA